VLKVAKARNTYVNYPNRTQEILRNKGVPQSKILEQASNPVQKPAIGGLKGPLQVEMETCRPQTGKSAGPQKAKKKENAQKYLWKLNQRKNLTDR